MTKTLTIQTPQDLKEQLENQAEEEMTSQAAITRKALKNYLSGADA